MARTGRAVSPSGIYHVLLRAQEKFFGDTLDYQIFLRTLQEYFDKTQYALLGYALLPARVHLVVYTGGDALSAVMKPFCTSYARSYNRLHQKNGKLFYDRYKSVPVETGKDLADVLAFVHAVPVRAGMHPEYSSLTEYIEGAAVCDTDRAIALAGGPAAIQAGNAKTVGLEDYLHMAPEETEQYVQAFSGYSFAQLQAMPKSAQLQALKELRGNKWFSAGRLAALLGADKKE